MYLEFNLMGQSTAWSVMDVVMLLHDYGLVKQAKRMKYGGCLGAVNGDLKSTRVADLWVWVLHHGRMDQDTSHGWVF